MIWKLLRQHISIAQLAGFFFANLCGMVIVLLGIQFYKDVLPVFTQGDSFMKKEFVIVSKKISTLGALAGKSSTFSTAEIDEMKQQPFAQSVGVFKPAQFKVSAGMGMQGMQLSTAMFFESVPDAFVDVKLDGWKYREGQDVIPIIIPRNYLNLYNFGFAQSRNLPQLSEGVMSMMPLDIHLSGRGEARQMKGRIVGFSNRLNTILVPESFMDWANEIYGEEGGAIAPSRLIVEVNNPTDDRIAKYFKEKGYDTEDDRLDAGKTTWFLKIVIGIVLSVGLLISLLSFYILMLSIYLLLQKNTTKLENLLLIGYSPGRVARPYQLLAILLNGIVWLLGIGIVLLVRMSYLDVLKRLFPDLQAGTLLPMFATGLLLFLGVSVVNAIVIRKKVNAIWYGR